MRALLEAGVPFDEMTPTGQRPIQIVKDNEGTKKLLNEWAKKIKEKKRREKKENKEKEEKARAEVLRMLGQDGEL